MSDDAPRLYRDRPSHGQAVTAGPRAGSTDECRPPVDRQRNPLPQPPPRGDIAELADGITLAPTAGWDLAAGALVGHARSAVGSTASTELVDGSVNFDVQAAPFTGTPSALLGRLNKIRAELRHARGSGAATRRYPVTTRHGVTGVGEDFVGVARQGSIVAFVFRPPWQSTREGVEIVVSGPQGPISRRRGDIVAMIRSIRTRP